MCSALHTGDITRLIAEVQADGVPPTPVPCMGALTSAAERHRRVAADDAWARHPVAPTSHAAAVTQHVGPVASVASYATDPAAVKALRGPIGRPVTGQNPRGGSA